MTSPYITRHKQESVSATRGLPSRYSNKSYEWCLDYKQMTRRCTIPTGSRKWSMEEMTAYLDWDKAEDKRVQVIVDDCGDGIRGHRGMDYIRKVVDREMGLDAVENRGV